MQTLVDKVKDLICLATPMETTVSSDQDLFAVCLLRKIIPSSLLLVSNFLHLHSHWQCCFQNSPYSQRSHSLQKWPLGLAIIQWLLVNFFKLLSCSTSKLYTRCSFFYSGTMTYLQFSWAMLELELCGFWVHGTLKFITLLYCKFMIHI